MGQALAKARGYKATAELAVEAKNWFGMRDNVSEREQSSEVALFEEASRLHWCCPLCGQQVRPSN